MNTIKVVYNFSYEKLLSLSGRICMINQLIMPISCDPSVSSTDQIRGIDINDLNWSILQEMYGQFAEKCCLLSWYQGIG